MTVPVQRLVLIQPDVSSPTDEVVAEVATVHQWPIPEANHFSESNSEVTDDPMHSANLSHGGMLPVEPVPLHVSSLLGLHHLNAGDLNAVSDHVPVNCECQCFDPKGP